MIGIRRSPHGALIQTPLVSGAHTCPDASTQKRQVSIVGKIGFKLIAFLIFVGGIFLVGFVFGGSFGSGMAADQFEACLPAQTVEELAPCANGGQP